MAERAVIKVTAHERGGANNAVYIGRLIQIERPHEAEPRLGEVSIGSRDELLAEMRESAGASREARADGEGEERVWGWNLPAFVAGESHGVWETKEGRALLESRSLSLLAHHLGLGPAPPSADKLPVAEKRENLIAHFSAMAELEERKGGLSHFRVILTVGPEVSLAELRAMANAFLRENFPLCPAFVAVHDDTEHRHAHVYVHARQIDGRRVALGQDYFRLDESWMRICAEHLGRPEIYDRHMHLKEETRGWKERDRKAREQGKTPPAKPDRWGDHHDTRLVFRPFDDRWCGRLRAQTRVAETKVEWLEAVKSKAEEVAAAKDDAVWLRERLDRAAERRAQGRSKSKRALPPEVITVSEAHDLLRYERDVVRAENGRGARAKGVAPAVVDGPRALDFDQPAAAPVKQVGFDFDGAAGPPREPDLKLPQSVPGRITPERERDRPEATAAITAAPTREDLTGRSFGRELVAEARLAHTESALNVEKSAKEKRKLKERLIEDRREHARASREAGSYRSILAAQGAAEPPCLLKEDERIYLRFMSGRVPEELRGRIAMEVARARIISDRDEEALTRHERGRASQATVLPQSPASLEVSRSAAGERAAGSNPTAMREAPAAEAHRPAHTAHARPAESAAEPTVTLLPDAEVGRMIVEHELAKARALALRAAESDLDAARHHWVSPTCGLSLADVEEQVALDPPWAMPEGEAAEARDCIRAELRAEHARLPRERLEAEERARSLGERLRAEGEARSGLGVPMPNGAFTAEDLRDLAECAVAARDEGLLRRVYDYERRLAVREAEGKGDFEPLGRLAERYIGAEFVAEVLCDRSRVRLEQAVKEPDKLPLHTTDAAGRDCVITFEQVAPRGGVIGAIGKAFESGEKRRLREQLAQKREEYTRHLRADAGAQESFHQATQTILRECHDLCRRFDAPWRGVPDLTAGQLREVRDYATTQQGRGGTHWLKVCAQSQKLKDERAREAASPQLPAYDEGSRQQWKENLTKEVVEMVARSQEQNRQQAERQKAARDWLGVSERSVPEPQKEKGRNSRGR